MTKPLPKYIELDAASVTVTLSKPTEINGIEADKIRLRAPTVRDLRIASKTANGDEELAEMNLFATLAEIGAKDLEGMSLKDYTRLQTGYFRLVHEDEA